jgi:hypothetical protein
MPSTVPNSGETGDTALQLGMHDRAGTLESALGGIDFFTRNFRADLVRLEFL